MKLTASNINEEILNKEVEVYRIVFHVMKIGKKIKRETKYYEEEKRLQ